MAKADLKKKEIDWRVDVGRAFTRMLGLAGVTQKEAAGLLDRDPAQIQRWGAGTERPQVDAIFAVERFRQPWVIALAELVGQGVEIETVVRIRKIA